MEKVKHAVEEEGDVYARTILPACRTPIARLLHISIPTLSDQVSSFCAFPHDEHQPEAGRSNVECSSTGLMICMQVEAGRRRAPFEGCAAQVGSYSLAALARALLIARVGQQHAPALFFVLPGPLL
jgi:hypothetical protein